MNKTENYQLNQWEKTDRIMMEDFNGDNAKIDAALKALSDTLADKPGRTEMADALPWVKIGEVTTTEASASAGISIPNASQYREIHVYIDSTGGLQCSLGWNGTAILLLNGAKDNYVTSRITGILEIMPLQTVGSALRYSFAANAGGYATINGSQFSLDCICGDSLTISIISGNDSYSLDVGTTFVAYGLKA